MRTPEAQDARLGTIREWRPRGRGRPPGRATAANRPCEPRTTKAAAPSGGHGSDGHASAWLGLTAVAGVLMVAFLVAGTLATSVALAVFGSIAAGLPEPADALEAIHFEQQSSIYDRTGKVLLATLGSDRRDLVTFDEIPAERIDATTSIEDKTFWENRGSTRSGSCRPPSTASTAGSAAHRPSRSAGPDSLARPRRRPGPPGPEGDGDRPVRAPHERDPGIEGKRLIMTAYLNNNFYGNRTYGVRRRRGATGTPAWMSSPWRRWRSSPPSRSPRPGTT